MADDELDRSLSEDGRAWDEAVGRLRESARAADSALRTARPPVEGGEKAREEMAVRLRELMPASEALRSASAEVRDAWDARHAEIRGVFARAAEAGDVDALFDVLGWAMAIESAAAEPPELARSSACLVEWGLVSPAFFGAQAACRVAARDLSDIRSICRIDAELVSDTIARARWAPAGEGSSAGADEEDAEA